MESGFGWRSVRDARDIGRTCASTVSITFRGTRVQRRCAYAALVVRTLAARIIHYVDHDRLTSLVVDSNDRNFIISVVVSSF